MTWSYADVIVSAMPHVGFQLPKTVRRSVWAVLIVALFLGGLSIDDQFDLPLGHASGTILSQVVEPDIDDFKLRELAFVFMLAIVFIGCRHTGTESLQHLSWGCRTPSPVLPYQFLSTYRI